MMWGKLIAIRGVLVAIFIFMTGCGRTDHRIQQHYKPNPPVHQSTIVSPSLSFSGHILNRAELIQACRDAQVAPPTCNSITYAEVKADWLPGLQWRFEKDLFRQGVVKWSPTFDCIYYTHAFIAFAQAEYHRDCAGRVPAVALAIVWIEYTRDTDMRYAKSKGLVPDGHSIVLILTDKGPKFWDPQIGGLELSHTELVSIFMREA